MTGSYGLEPFTAHDASEEGARKENKGLDFWFFLKNLVDLLKSLVATAYIDCKVCAPYKQLRVEYTTLAHKATYCVCIVRLLCVSNLCARSDLCVQSTAFARKATYCVRIVQLLRVSDLLCTYTTCALEATCAYDVRLVRVKRLIAYV